MANVKLYLYPEIITFPVACFVNLSLYLHIFVPIAFEQSQNWCGPGAQTSSSHVASLLNSLFAARACAPKCEPACKLPFSVYHYDLAKNLRIRDAKKHKKTRFRDSLKTPPRCRDQNKNFREPEFSG